MTKEQLRQAYEKAESEYRQAVEWKLNIEREFADMNVLVDGRRATEVEYNAWKQRKLKEKLNIERELRHKKQKKREAHDAWHNAEKQDFTDQRKAKYMDEIQALKQANALLQIENRDLRSKNIDLETKLLTVNRQFDIAIRQWNALPPTVREQMA